MECNNTEFYIEHLDVTDSTNNYIRANRGRLWQVAGDRPVVVYADEQTAGRGQRGNVWQSHAGENLLVSIMVRPQAMSVSSQFALSQAAALAVKAAMGYLDINVVLKWPNDIYVGGRKLAGILVETDSCGAVVDSAIIGIGINVNQTEFPPMDKVPVSIKTLLGSGHAVGDVLSALLDAFSYYFNMMVQRGDYSSIAAEYKRSLLGYLKPMRYRAGGKEFDATIKDVGSDGRLRLLLGDGTEVLYAFKEVEVVI